MLISKEKKFMFYHVYKVAGTSIRRSLMPYCEKKQVVYQAGVYAMKLAGVKANVPPIYDYHPMLRDVRAYMGGEFYDYYRFCIVRNPLDWQKSLYFFAKKNQRHHQHRLISNLTFDEYLNWRIDSDFKLESDLFYDGGECLVDEIGRFESLDSDFEDICEHIGVVVKLKHLNVAGLGKAVNISPATLDRFKYAFEADYHRLGYDINSAGVM